MKDYCLDVRNYRDRRCCAVSTRFIANHLLYWSRQKCTFHWHYKLAIEFINGSNDLTRNSLNGKSNEPTNYSTVYVCGHCCGMSLCSLLCSYKFLLIQNNHLARYLLMMMFSIRIHESVCRYVFCCSSASVF